MIRITFLHAQLQGLSLGHGGCLGRHRQGRDGGWHGDLDDVALARDLE